MADRHGRTIVIVKEVTELDHASGAARGVRDMSTSADRLRDYADRDCRPAHRDMVRGLSEQLRGSAQLFDAGLLRDCMLFTNDLDVSRGQSFADVNGELLGCA